MTAITCSIRSNSSDEMGRWTPFGEGLELATDVFPLYSKTARSIVVHLVLSLSLSSSVQRLLHRPFWNHDWNYLGS